MEDHGVKYPWLSSRHYDWFWIRKKASNFNYNRQQTGG